jgi:hypothetical protein
MAPNKNAGAAGATKNLSVEEIRASIARCRVTLDFPVDIEALVQPKRKAKRSAKAKSKAPVQGGQTLLSLIEAGVLKPPVHLTRTYKGKALAAVVQATGMIRIGREEFGTPSAAAVAAMESVTGTRATVNGWDFWQVAGPDGGLVPLGTLRSGAPQGGKATG